MLCPYWSTTGFNGMVNTACADKVPPHGYILFIVGVSTFGYISPAMWRLRILRTTHQMKNTANGTKAAVA